MKIRHIDWKAWNWDPDQLVAMYKCAGARHFFAMANHHNNFDLWNSKYHAWNSVDIGPKKDIIARWAKAAKKQGLPFGLIVHSSRVCTFTKFYYIINRNK